jgi:phosphoglycolate phosphatase
VKSTGSTEKSARCEARPTLSRDGIRHILWDWNGTLLDDVELCVSALNRVSARRDLPPISIERYREVFTFPVIDYYRAVGFDFDEEPFDVPADEWVDIYCTEVWDSTRLREDAPRVLAHFHESGYSQSMLSAHNHDMLAKLVAFFGVADYFDQIVGLDDFYAHGKTELGKAWLSDTGHRPDRVLMVGDTLHDFEVAQALGTRCVLIEGGHQSGKRLQGAGVSVHGNLRGLWDALGH